MARTFLKRIFQRKYLWIWLGIFSLLLRFLFSSFPQLTEIIYSRGIYLVIRWIQNHTFGLFPFHSFLWLIPLLLLIIFLRWNRARKRGNKGNWKIRLVRTGRHFLSLIGGVAFFFFVLWGYNYNRVPIDEHLGLELPSPDTLMIASELRTAGLLAEGARQQIPGIGQDTLSADLGPEDLEAVVASEISATLRRLGYPAAERARGRVIQPGGWMLSLGVAGIHNPFTGEGNISGGLTDVQIPFTMAHEMAHGHGFGDEGTCNFIALLTCFQSSNPYVRYSGRMAWWDYLASRMRRDAPYTFGKVYQRLPRGFKTDWIAIRYNRRRYQGRGTRLGNKVNDQYLKFQGVKGGIRSYSRVILFNLAWEAK